MKNFIVCLKSLFNFPLDSIKFFKFSFSHHFFLSDFKFEGSVRRHTVPVYPVMIWEQQVRMLSDSVMIIEAMTIPVIAFLQNKIVILSIIVFINLTYYFHHDIH